LRKVMLATLATAAAASVLLASSPASALAKGGTGYVRYFDGSPIDVVAPMSGGTLLSGGGVDDDTAMRWLMSRGGGKVDVVVLDAWGKDIYTRPFMDFWGADSVETFVFSSREAAKDPDVLAAIDHAEVIWLDGGDQSKYVAYWQGTELAQHVDARVKAGASFGGMSAGLAIQGGWVYSAENGSATSSAVLANPYDKDVTFAQRVFDLPWMANTLTDTHFKVRDRMGRLLGFLGRLEKEPGITASAPKAIAVDEDTSLGVDPKSGDVQIFGTGGGAWFVRTDSVTSRIVAPKTPLTYGPVSVQHVNTGDTFNLSRWSGRGANAYAYALSADKGALVSSTGSNY
jgi:cyanophycinase